MKPFNAEKIIVIFGFIAELCAIALILCFFFSCKTTKTKTRTKAELSGRENMELMESSAGKSNLSQTDYLKNILSVQTGIFENMLFALYSAPDSLGRQYPVAVGKANRQTNISREEKSDAGSNTEITGSKTANTNLKAKSESDFKSGTQEAKEEKMKAPAWIELAGLAAIAGIIISITGFLNKKK